MKNLPQKVRSKKLSSRVDLTAMVSVSFLLIIFFMVVGELSKPKTIGLNLPEKDAISCGEPSIACHSGNRFYTILLGNNNKLITYAGLLEIPLEKPKKTNYTKNGLRADLKRINKKTLEYSVAKGKRNQGLIVL